MDQKMQAAVVFPNDDRTGTEKKEQAKIVTRKSFQRDARRKSSKLHLKLINDEYGEYFEFEDVPYHVMGSMIQQFKSFEFNNKFNKHAVTITAS